MLAFGLPGPPMCVMVGGSVEPMSLSEGCENKVRTGQLSLPMRLYLTF